MWFCIVKLDLNNFYKYCYYIPSSEESEMATSDSEDFESADENLDAEVLKRNDTESQCISKEKDSNKSEGSDLCRDGKKETAGRELHEMSKGSSSDNNTEVLSSYVVDSVTQSGEGMGGSTVSKGKKMRAKDERARRPQKPREPKSSGSVRKLGTKISSSSMEKVKFASDDECTAPTGLRGAVMDSSKDNTTPVLDKLPEMALNQESELESGWGGWGGWGVTSLLSSATESVTTLTTHVSQGLSTVLEAGIGAPDPEELARLQQEEQLKLLEEKQQNEANELSELRREEEERSESESSRIFGFGNLISGVTKLVETTGSKVLTGGLDTLETIGKKTMQVLQEGDPGLKKKRALFSDKIVLSQVLREAKEKAEQIEDKEATRKAHFETLFDDYQGLVHLEALEMLSKQCDIKLQSLLLSSSGGSLIQLQQSLQEVKALCQLPDEEEDESDVADWRETLDAASTALGIPFTADKFNKTWDEAEHWLSNRVTSDGSVREIHQKAIATLAQLTAESVEQFHKAAELLLVKEDRNPTDEAQILLQVTSVLSSQVSVVATRFSECLNTAADSSPDPHTVSALITNVFLEAANSSSYIQEAFQLLVPVLQVGLPS